MSRVSNGVTSRKLMLAASNASDHQQARKETQKFDETIPEEREN